MKLTLILILFCLAGIGASSYSQNIRFDVSYNGSNIVELFKQLEGESEFYFFYQKEDLKSLSTISVEAENATVMEILDDVLNGTSLDYKIVDRYIIIRKAGSDLSTLTKKLLQQQGNITGKVTDDTGNPVPGVTVLVKGTTLGTITDIDGNYSLNNVPDEAILMFSFVGMRSQEIPVEGKTVINITMEQETIGLDEVVAIGYGTVRKSDLTGSVGTVKKEVINSQVVENPLMALTGITPGVQVIQTSGEPGSSIGVRIRGANSILGGNNPLYVVDGFPITGNLDNINPNDIESMEVLKDASATAIYGSRGANGVVMVTTKKGTAGKTSVEYNGYFGIQKETKRIDLLNAKEFATLANVRAANDGVAPYFSDSEITLFGEGTDWQDEIFELGTIQNHSLIISGGSSKTKFNISANYFDHQGIIRNSFSNRYQLKLDIQHEISDNWKISAQNILSRTKKNDLVSDNSTRGAGILSGALDAPPTIPVYDADGNYSDPRVYPFSPDVMENPVLMTNEIKNHLTKNSNLLNLAIEGVIFKDFTLRSSLGLEYYDRRTDFYSTTLYDRSYTGRAKIGYNDFTNLLNENTLTYFKEIGDHTLTVVGGVTSQKTTYQAVNAASNGYLTDVLENYNLESGSTIETSTSSYTDYSILSYLGRVNYSFKGKYLLTASIRADGSSRFGENSKWGYFPSAAAAWKVNEEEFWPGSGVVNSLKVRGSWGNTGNTAVSAYQSLATLSSISVVFDDNSTTAFAPGSTKPNPDLKWETTEQWDVGVDVGLFNNRLSFSADYYQKTTTDLLANVPLTPSSGYSSITSNIGSTQNKGFEMSASYKLVQGEFSWDLGANISFNRNKVLELSQGADIFGSKLDHPLSIPVSIVREGYPMGVFYGYKEDGLTEDGQIKYVDSDKSGEFNALDRVIIGDPNPDFIFGVNSFMSYKNFGLTLVLTGVQGNDVFNFNVSNVADGFSFGINQIQDVLGNYWTEENPNPNAKYPKISENTRYEVSDRYIEDGSYIKLQNLELSYTINRPGSFPLNNSQIYVGGQNLLMLTKYSWYSPEVNTKGSGISRGIDMNGYPMTRTFLLGVRIKL